MNIRLRTYILGIIFGLVTPFVGVFAGLAVSSILGNILAFPLLVVSIVTDKPFGQWDGGLWLVAMLISAIIWIAIFQLIDKAVNH